MGLVIGGATALAGGLMGAGAAKSAANAQSAALQQALDFQKQVYATNQGNLNPFIGAGTNALGALQQLYGLAPSGTGGGGNALQSYQNFTQTPFYQFPLSQGVQTLNASGAAHGLTLSGGQAKALQAYGQGYAGQNFNSYISALAGLANLGGQSASSLAGVGNQAAATNLTGETGLGNAQASGIIGRQNQINNALGAIPSLLGYGNPTGGAYQGQNGGGLSGLVGGLFQNQTVGNYSIPGTSTFGSYGSLFGNAAPGTSGGFNNGTDLIGSSGGVIVPPIPPG